MLLLLHYCYYTWAYISLLQRHEDHSLTTVNMVHVCVSGGGEGEVRGGGGGGEGNGSEGVWEERKDKREKREKERRGDGRDSFDSLIHLLKGWQF